MVHKESQSQKITHGGIPPLSPSQNDRTVKRENRSVAARVGVGRDWGRGGPKEVFVVTVGRYLDCSGAHTDLHVW